LEPAADLIADAQLVADYAVLNRLSLPPDCLDALRAAAEQRAQLLQPGPARERFMAAFDAAVAALPLSVSGLRAAALRRERLQPLVSNAQRLLGFAASNGKRIDEDVRNTLVACADAMAKGAPTVETEQEFLKAYGALTTATLPVTADTLEASEMKRASVSELLSSRSFSSAWGGLKLGRFVHASVFGALLIVTGISLNYFTVGASMLERYQSLVEKQRLQNEETVKSENNLKVLKYAMEQNGQSAKDPTPSAEQQKLLEATRVLYANAQRAQEISEERSVLPSRLWDWAMQPCRSEANAVFSWTLCSSMDSQSSKPAGQVEMLEAARLVASRASGLYLPLLMGLLGAYAFVLRKMTKEISDNSLARASALQHIVRLALGALAGFASSFLLTPELVGGAQIKSLSSWAIAFIAGYGIELVFAFMDRIISAFTERPG
jgi:hypothetical protein